MHTALAALLVGAAAAGLAPDGSCPARPQARSGVAGSALLQHVAEVYRAIEREEAQGTIKKDIQTPFYPDSVMSCPGAPVLTTPSMTLSLYDQITASIIAVAQSLPSTCNASFCPQAEWTGCVLRLAGHDFMDYHAGKYGVGAGGSDGCILLSDADNAGLAGCLYTGMSLPGMSGLTPSLLPTYQSYCTKVSLADFIVIAAEAVMNYTRGLVLKTNPTAATVNFRSSFKYGRTTAQTCLFSAGMLPNPELGCKAVGNTFVANMNLNWTGAAALMGVHTLGRARTANSGYNGWWTSPQGAMRFDNDFYIHMISKGWTPQMVARNPAKNQWTRSDGGAPGAPAYNNLLDPTEMMLTTDICLAFSNATGGPRSTVTTNSNTPMVENLNCCTWVDPSKYPSGWQNDGNNYCGNTTIVAQLLSSYKVSVTTHNKPIGVVLGQQCCQIPLQKRKPGSCGDPGLPGGYAIDAVIAFTKSEATWLATFHSAWATATQNGFTGLQPLRR